MDCSVCCYSSLNINRCRCKFKTCFNCIKKIDKLYCINCNKSLTKNIINQIKTETNIYKKHIILSRLNSYDNTLIKEIILNIENKKLLRFGTQEIDTSIKYIFSCLKCSGFVNLNYICNLCKSKYCEICEDLLQENHICDKNNIDSLEIIKQNYKKCPFCFTYIEKIPNTCNDMKCVCCGIYFKWNDLLIDTANSNNHYNDQLLRPDLHKMYLNEKKKNNLIKKKTDMVDKEKIFCLFRTRTEKRDYKGIQICNNIINKINKHYKKINFLEYTYFIENKQISDKLIEKLYYSYKSIEYYETIMSKIINFMQKKRYDYVFLITTKFFKNLIKTMAKKEFPDKVKYYLKNVYLNKQKSDNIFNEYFYIPTYKIISQNYNDFGLIKILNKFKIAHHISNYNSKISILNVLVHFKITNVLIITNKISIDEWKTSIQDYIFNIIFIPIHKIEKYKRNKNIIKLFEKKKPEFINENSILIIENNSKIILNNDTINYLSLFVRSFKNAYFIFICNGSCLETKKHCNTYYNLIFCYDDNFGILNILLKNFSKKEIFELIVKNYEFYNTNDKFVQKTKPYGEYCIKFFMDLMEKYKIDANEKYVIYRSNNIFYIVDKIKSKIITQSHKKCEKNKKCVYCIECSGIRYKNKYKTSIDKSICCHIHSLAFYNIRPHKIYLIEDKPVFYSISPNLNLINKRYLLWKNLYFDTAFYLEQLGFSIYELCLMYNNDKYLLSTIEDYIIKNTLSADSHDLNITNHVVKLNYEDTKAIINAYENYDIVKNYIITFKHLILKGKMLTEQVYLKYINQYIKDNIDDNSTCNIKFIIILEFNKNIEDMINLLENINIKNILYIFNNKKKQYSLNLFKNSDNHKILILNSNALIPKQDLSKFNINIIFTNKDICQIYLKNDLIYSKNYKYIQLNISPDF